MSLMKRHQTNCGQVLGTMPPSGPGNQAAQAAQAAPTASLPAAPGLLGGQQLAALVSAALAEDVKALKDISSKERKAELKRTTLIPKYRDYVARLRAGEAQHEVIGWFLVWLMDAALVEEAQELARHCVATGQKLPDNFKAEPGYFYADTLLTWAEGEFAAGRAFAPYVADVLADVAAAPEAWNLPDALLARCHRLQGLAAERAEDWHQAQAELTRAMELGAKVKTVLDGVNKRLEA